MWDQESLFIQPIMICVHSHYLKIIYLFFPVKHFYEVTFVHYELRPMISTGRCLAVSFLLLGDLECINFMNFMGKLLLFRGIIQLPTSGKMQ